MTLGKPFPLKIGETITCSNHPIGICIDIDKLNVVVNWLEINGASLLIKYPGIPSRLVNLDLTFKSAASTLICKN